MTKRKPKRGSGWWRRLKWPAVLLPYRRHLLIGAALTGALVLGVMLAFYVRYGRVIDARLHGERDRVVPRVFARPLALHPGQNLSEIELITRLNDVGYAQRARVERAGEFAIDTNSVVLIPRGGSHAGLPVVVNYPAPPAARKGAAPKPAPPPTRISRLDANGKPVDEVALDPPMLTALVSGVREKRRRVALETIPARMQQAVLAIEDRRFYFHPGFDPFGIAGAVFTNLTSSRRVPVGRSTLTQQLARMFFLSDEFNAELQSGQRSYARKLREGFMAIILETKATKDEIFELYLNDVYLGNRGSFALHGVAEAAKMFFGKDVSNLTLGEAALIAGVIQNPAGHSPFNNPERAKERRNAVLRAMADADFITAEAAERASHDPVVIVARALDNEAPYFVDYLSQNLDEAFPGVTGKAGTLDVYSTLDLNLQRYAVEAVRDGIAKIDTILARRKRGPKRVAQAALVAVDPRTGEILAMIGGRSYNTSQYNRAAVSRRQIGSTFKPFVYLAAFEKTANEGTADLTPATTVFDEPTSWHFDNQDWSPHNYGEEYDGEITLRRALAMSRNIATIKVAEQTGFDRVVALWKKTKLGAEGLKPYPSIALGTLELTPLEAAEAYTLFANGGTTRKLRAIASIRSGDQRLKPAVAKGANVARPATAFLVTNMMRSVLNEGTGSAARAAGFTADAAAKSGTTNDLKDAWFIGFTPELLTVVWVGLDENQPLGMSGAQAALPIWTSFMIKALTGRQSPTFDAPAGVTFVEVDRDTGKIATPNCPRITNEAFLTGTEPLEACELHR
ncbi:MAG: PBP1A family penicillin-binding protein [Vicinamibacterales bacterium]